MNSTHIEHLIIAIVIQLAIGLSTGLWITATAVPIALFLGREHAQREYVISKPHLLKGYEALDIWRWGKDAILDLAIPTVAVLGIYFWMTR